MSNSTETVCMDDNDQVDIHVIELESQDKNEASPNKKLSESRLRMTAVSAIPTNVEAQISLKEALKGTVRSFIVKDQIICTSCSTAKPINRLRCQCCKGLGYTYSERIVEIALSAGLVPGQEIRFPDLGAKDSRFNKNGDLIVRVKLNDHPYFKVNGNNVSCTLTVSLFDAALGSNIEVPTVDGKVVMVLRPLTKPGTVYRLKGLGINGGDQLLTIDVEMPTELNAEQIRLFKEIKKMAELNKPVPLCLN